MKDSEVRKNRHYVHPHFGILRIVGHFMEGERGSRRKVYEGQKPHDNCNYNFTADELTREATVTEFFGQPNT